MVYKNIIKSFCGTTCIILRSIEIHTSKTHIFIESMKVIDSLKVYVRVIDLGKNIG